MINNYVKMICGMLEIPMPRVFYSDNALRPGEHARLSQDGKQLYLRKLKTASLDQLFAASCELRREWQRRTDRERYCGSHKPADRLSVRDFSMQPAEVDANAFGAVVCLAFFGVEPVFDELPGVVRSSIESRIDEIRRDEFPQLAAMRPHE